MIKRNGTRLSLVQKVRGVGLFDTKGQIAGPYYLWISLAAFKCKCSNTLKVDGEQDPQIAMQ